MPAWQHGWSLKRLETVVSLALQLVPASSQQDSNLLAVKGGPASLSLYILCRLHMHSQYGLAAGICQLPCPAVHMPAAHDELGACTLSKHSFNKPGILMDVYCLLSSEGPTEPSLCPEQGRRESDNIDCDS